MTNPTDSPASTPAPVPTTVSVHHVPPSTVASDADTITLRMGKSTLAFVIAALLGTTAVGGGVATGLSDNKVEDRVEAALDKVLEKKLDGKLDGRLKEARDAAAAASASAASTAATITSLRDLVVEQSAESKAAINAGAEARRVLEASVKDHEQRLRDVERALFSGRR